MLDKPDITLSNFNTEESNEGYGMKYRIDIRITSGKHKTTEVRKFIRELHDYLAGDDA